MKLQYPLDHKVTFIFAVYQFTKRSRSNRFIIGRVEGNGEVFLRGTKGQNIDTDSWSIVRKRFPSTDVTGLRCDKIGVLGSVATGRNSSKNLRSTACRYVIERQVKRKASRTAARVRNLLDTHLSVKW